jgi:acetylornithine deacetylase
LVSTWPSEIVLLRDLIAIPSVSGTEAAIGEAVERTARAWGLDVERGDDGVLIRAQGSAPGSTLALVSHLDTVPAGEGWTRPPFDPVVEGDRLHGRGSGDAKASVAAMMAAARDAASRRGQWRGRLLVLLGYGEETRDTSMPRLAARAGSIDAAVIGEPTGNRAVVAQRGLMVVELIARGEQRHAAHAVAGNSNAITSLALDLIRLDGILADRVHPVLGAATATPTVLEAGVARNVTPPTAKAILDVRSTPSWTHDEIEERLAERLQGEVVVASDRLVPCETPAGSRLLAAARTIARRLEMLGSPTCSDWVFLRDTDAFKCGPGDSRRSHAPDEWVEVGDVTAARAFYGALALEYLR